MSLPNHATPAPSDASSPVPKRLSILFTLAWVATLLMLVAAVARVLWHDGQLLLVWINSFTAYVYLPAYVIGLVALWRRCWKLSLASLVIVVCHLVWMWPNFQPEQELVDGATSAPRVRLFSANLFTGNYQHEAMIAEIRKADANVLVFQEWSPTWRDALTDSGTLQPYPHQIELPQRGSFGLAICSKTPFDHEEIWFNAGLPTGRVTVRVGNHQLRLYNIHSMPPRDRAKLVRGNDYWRAMLDQLARETGPVVLIGDFNATQHSHSMSRLLAAGFRSAHVDRGRGFAVTWPNDRWRMIPPIRVDHCLISREIACLAIEEGRGRGSDHRPLVVDLAILDAPDQPAGEPN